MAQPPPPVILRQAIIGQEIHFEIAGQPRVQERPRFAGPRGGGNVQVYHRQTQERQRFQRNVQHALQLARQSTQDLNQGVYFSPRDLVSVEILFHMRRPNAHFRNDNRDEEELTQAAQQLSFSNARGDVDNLAKFVLDSLSSTVYHDDRTVVVLKIAKVNHNAPPFQGATEIRVQKLHRHGPSLHITDI